MTDTDEIVRKLKQALGLGENETLKSSLGLAENETFADGVKSALGMTPDETLAGVIEDKLGLEEGGKVELPRQLNSIRSDLTTLYAANPDAVLVSLHRSIVGVEDGPIEEVLKRNLSTWTYLRPSIRPRAGSGDHTASSLAVGAAHCALYYEAKDQDFSFVEIPKELAENDAVVEVGLLDNAVFGKNPRYRDEDVVVLTLDPTKLHFEAEDLLDFDIWETTRDTIPSCGAKTKVAGVTHADCVRGSGWAVNDDDGTFFFIVHTSEPGNSGTLLYAINIATGKRRILGVFSGTEERGNFFRNYKFRGIICPLPPLGEFNYYGTKTLPVSVTNFVVRHFSKTKTGTRFKLEKEITLRPVAGKRNCFRSSSDGKLLYGVLIKTGSNHIDT